MEYNKLVRNNIPQIVEAAGKVAQIHTATEEEYNNALRAKLLEETNEFIGSGSSEELADILEVLYALAEQNGISPTQLEQVREEKEQKRGNFSKRIILETVE